MESNKGYVFLFLIIVFINTKNMFFKNSSLFFKFSIFMFSFVLQKKNKL